MTLTLSQILIAALGTVLTGLATWIVTVLTTWLNTKIKDKKLASLLNSIMEIVTNAVKATYQSYVESIKGTDLWNDNTQKEALNKALIMIKEQLSTEAIAFIKENYGDMQDYLVALIESVLYNLKKK